MKADKCYMVALISDYEDEYRVFAFRDCENAKKKFLSFSEFCIEDIPKKRSVG